MDNKLKKRALTDPAQEAWYKFFKLLYPDRNSAEKVQADRDYYNNLYQAFHQGFHYGQIYRD